MCACATVRARCRASMCLRERGAVRSAAVHVYVSAGVCGDHGVRDAPDAAASLARPVLAARV